MAEQKKGWFDVVKSSYVWKSMFRPKPAPMTTAFFWKCLDMGSDLA